MYQWFFVKKSASNHNARCCIVRPQHGGFTETRSLTQAGLCGLFEGVNPLMD